MARAVRIERVFPEGVAPEQCKLSHSRPIWRIENGAAVIVATHDITLIEALGKPIMHLEGGRLHDQPTTPPAKKGKRG